VKQEKLNWLSKNPFYNHLHYACNFINSISSYNLKIVKKRDHYDININNIEVGSYYQNRKHSGYTWSCGTGLALPRFTVANERRK